MSGPGTFFGLEIGRRGLQAERQALEVVGHNLSNASTEGYSRQEAVHEATDPYCNPVLNQKLLPGQIGTGVEITYIRRYRDLYMDNQWRDVACSQGYWEGLNESLKKVEAAFPEPDEEYGLQTLIGKFFNAWEDLNNTPQDIGPKAAVREAGAELATTFRQTYMQLSDVRNNIDSVIDEKVARINSLTQQITEVSTAIARIIKLGEQPNDLLDKRDLLLDELGKIGRVTVENSADGYVSVSLYGQELVAFDNSRVDITRADAEGWAATNPETGMLVGYFDALDKVDEYMSMMDELALGLTNVVNALHATTTASGTYPDFFTATGAADFNLSADVQSAITNVNGDMALDIGGLRTDLTMLGNTATFEGYYRGLTTMIGADTQGSADRLGTQNAVMTQVDNLRESLIGVSTDEELTKMIQFQYAYQSSARTITVMDELLDTLINRTAV
ncbi:flagellar hook-associated protein FlgK [Pelotomaculum terephthalicicum JT]|uniref:flagellar hook-associated protein FlgK n=1 Tax=Pelotomaculum TaxID=191373 RepID=UPI0009D4F4E6|nr:MULTISPECIES: flagellar hook-associated protein FlgK [Pelotomaculum]MCG9968004.1 flagellar hook-associated protein FlgK [Pelotomaculum terephthalicicum JT]OPX88605.1 MAG: Flagellar hook-associated protein 1 [Pelotomaculum sp. PtaB.Bin117]OPY60819.1 MAG: Flagellar hook-associated protein 1 [Pelotomaculum sp. PtaU1.Bin065]